MGAKAIGDFGKLDLKGGDVGSSWVKLAQPATAGDNSVIVTADDLSKWKVGDEVVVTSTSYVAHEAEVASLTSVTDNGDGTWTLGLDTSLQVRSIFLVLTTPLSLNSEILGCAWLPSGSL